MANALESPGAHARDGHVSEEARRAAEVKRAARDRQLSVLELQREIFSRKELQMQAAAPPLKPRWLISKRRLNPSAKRPRLQQQQPRLLLRKRQI
ncbi:MAG: hypothetical protein WDM87_10165 [Terracidiphilus sp.]